MADQLRVAVIGVGAMGANHVRVLEELPDVELLAIADNEAARLAGETRGRSLRAYRDYRRLLDEERPDAVVIAVPTRLHTEVALACIEHDAVALVEKPLAATVAEGEELRAAAEARGVPLVVGHIERFNPAVRELARRLREGELGRIYQAQTRRIGPFYRRERDVGVVFDLATHDIDVLRMLLGCDVEGAQAETLRGVRTEFEDALAGLLRFENGTMATLEVNWLSPVKVRDLTLIGERGMFALDYIARTLRSWPAQREAEGEPEDIIVPDGGQEPLRAELEAFLHTVRGAPPTVSAEDGIAAMRVAEALIESARRGEAVRLTTARPAS